MLCNCHVSFGFPVAGSFHRIFVSFIPFQSLGEIL